MCNKFRWSKQNIKMGQNGYEPTKTIRAKTAKSTDGCREAKQNKNTQKTIERLNSKFKVKQFQWSFFVAPLVHDAFQHISNSTSLCYGIATDVNTFNKTNRLALKQGGATKILRWKIYVLLKLSNEIVFPESRFASVILATFCHGYQIFAPFARSKPSFYTVRRKQCRIHLAKLSKMKDRKQE